MSKMGARLVLWSVGAETMQPTASSCSCMSLCGHCLPYTHSSATSGRELHILKRMTHVHMAGSLSLCASSRLRWWHVQYATQLRFVADTRSRHPPYSIPSWECNPLHSHEGFGVCLFMIMYTRHLKAQTG